MRGRVALGRSELVPAQGVARGRIGVAVPRVDVPTQRLPPLPDLDVAQVDPAVCLEVVLSAVPRLLVVPEPRRGVDLLPREAPPVELLHGRARPPLRAAAVPGGRVVPERRRAARVGGEDRETT